MDPAIAGSGNLRGLGQGLLEVDESGLAKGPLLVRHIDADQGRAWGAREERVTLDEEVLERADGVWTALPPGFPGDSQERRRIAGGSHRLVMALFAHAPAPDFPRDVRQPEGRPS